MSNVFVSVFLPAPVAHLVDQVRERMAAAFPGALVEVRASRSQESPANERCVLGASGVEAAEVAAVVAEVFKANGLDAPETA